MPINRLVVKKEVATYAAVLLNAANEAGGFDTVMEVRQQLEQVARIVRTNAELQDVLGTSAYTSEQRINIARQVFADCNPVLVEVLAVMAERMDIALVSRVFASFGEQLESALDLAVVEVTTAVSLDDHLRDVITKKTEADLGKKVYLVETVDPSILGGIIMSTGGKRIDASVISQLESARETLRTI